MSATPVPHPDYRSDPNTFSGERCECGGIRHWHAPSPYGCDDCDCTAFTPVREHRIRVTMDLVVQADDTAHALELGDDLADLAYQHPLATALNDVTVTLL